MTFRHVRPKGDPGGHCPSASSTDNKCAPSGTHVVYITHHLTPFRTGRRINPYQTYPQEPMVVQTSPDPMWIHTFVQHSKHGFPEDHTKNGIQACLTASCIRFPRVLIVASWFIYCSQPLRSADNLHTAKECIHISFFSICGPSPTQGPISWTLHSKFASNWCVSGFRKVCLGCTMAARCWRSCCMLVENVLTMFRGMCAVAIISVVQKCYLGRTYNRNMMSVRRNSNWGSLMYIYNQIYHLWYLRAGFVYMIVWQIHDMPWLCMYIYI